MDTVTTYKHICDRMYRMIAHCTNDMIPVRSNIIESLLSRYGHIVCWILRRRVRQSDSIFEGFVVYDNPWDTKREEAFLTSSFSVWDIKFKVYKRNSPKTWARLIEQMGKCFWPVSGISALQFNENEPRSYIEVCYSSNVVPSIITIDDKDESDSRSQKDNPNEKLQQNTLTQRAPTSRKDTTPNRGSRDARDQQPSAHTDNVQIMQKEQRRRRRRSHFIVLDHTSFAELCNKGYEVTRVVDKRIEANRVQYFIRLMGPQQPSILRWIPFQELRRWRKLLNEFNKERRLAAKQ